MASGLNTQSNRTLRYEQRIHMKNISKQKIVVEIVVEAICLLLYHLNLLLEELEVQD